MAKVVNRLLSTLSIGSIRWQSTHCFQLLDKLDSFLVIEEFCCRVRQVYLSSKSVLPEGKEGNATLKLFGPNDLRQMSNGYIHSFTSYFLLFDTKF